MNITEDYCSYDVAKLLKEKGFDTFKSYGWDEQLFDKEHPRNFSIGFDNKEHWISCPTLQMAMKWLREVHKIFIVIIPRLFYSDGSCDSFAYSIWADDNLDVDGEEEWDELYESYEEAVEAALKYCIENLV